MIQNEANLITSKHNLTENYWNIQSLNGSFLKGFLQKQKPMSVESKALQDGTILHAMILEGKPFESLVADVGEFAVARGKEYDKAVENAKFEFGGDIIPMKTQEYLKNKVKFYDMSIPSRAFLIQNEWLFNVEMAVQTTLFGIPVKGILDAIKIDKENIDKVTIPTVASR
jgi:hypothetical protein